MHNIRKILHCLRFLIVGEHESKILSVFLSFSVNSLAYSILLLNFAYEIG